MAMLRHRSRGLAVKRAANLCALVAARPITPPTVPFRDISSEEWFLLPHDAERLQLGVLTRRETMHEGGRFFSNAETLDTGIPLRLGADVQVERIAT